jgi:hypothetical protein
MVGDQVRSAHTRWGGGAGQGVRPGPPPEPVAGSASSSYSGARIEIRSG